MRKLKFADIQLEGGCEYVNMDGSIIVINLGEVMNS